MKRDRRAMFFALVLGLSGIACYSTGPTEVGVRVVKFGIFTKKGVQKEVYPPGATYFFLPVVNDWFTFDTKLQNLHMVASPDVGDRPYNDAIRFKTKDGNDISVDVTVAWRIDPKMAAYLLEKVGTSIDEIKDKVVRPICRTVVRDVLNELSSEDFYVAAKRRRKAQKARELLRKYLGREGIIIEQVILKEYRFNKRYQQIIQARKLAEQRAEALKSEARAALEKARRELQKAQGIVRQKIARARGQMAQIKYQADAAYIRMRRQAEAILAEAQAEARAILERNKALAGSGGKVLVLLKIAEALKNKKIVLLPVHQKSGLGIQTMNLNKLLASFLGIKPPSQSKKPSPPPRPVPSDKTKTSNPPRSARR